jgi:predicted RNA-binding protein
MCEANAYMETDGKEMLILESVNIVEPQADGSFRLVTIFGEQKIVYGCIKGMCLVDHRILFTNE